MRPSGGLFPNLHVAGTNNHESPIVGQGDGTARTTIRSTLKWKLMRIIGINDWPYFASPRPRNWGTAAAIMWMHETDHKNSWEQMWLHKNKRLRRLSCCLPIRRSRDRCHVSLGRCVPMHYEAVIHKTNILGGFVGPEYTVWNYAILASHFRKASRFKYAVMKDLWLVLSEWCKFTLR